MKPLAILPVFNEADILPWTLRHIVDQGCEPFVLDNMSTDNPVSVMTPGNPVYGWDSDFEQIFTSGKYDWTAILTHVEEIALERGKGRWCMLYDADEIRRAVGPFHGTTLAEACARVEAEGYNAIDHYVRCFAPIDNGYQGDPKSYFRHYLPEHIDEKMKHIKCWLQGDECVDLHTHGGHQVMFHGRRVYPVPFLLKHYPIRSQQHGERKVFQERLPRYLESERAKKWHVQYDGLQMKIYFVEISIDMGRTWQLTPPLWPWYKLSEAAISCTKKKRRHPIYDYRVAEFTKTKKIND